MVSVVVIGKTGQVAQALAAVIPTAKFLGRDEFDLLTADVEKLGKPEIIINAAAYTAVDKAESEPEVCDKANHLAVKKIAKYCVEHNILFVHYSTDYVFNGKGNKPFTEDDTKDLFPLNTYGATKLAAEKAVIKSGCKYYILRTSWVYSPWGSNFVKTMERLKERPELKVVNDQIGCPTYAPDIAENTLKLLTAEPPYGIYHFTGSEHISWYDFAKLILPQNNIKPIPSAEYPTPAQRPQNSRLDTAKLNKLGITFPPVKESLKKCMSAIS